MTGQRFADLVGNPLLAAHAAWLVEADAAARTEAITRFAFAVPTDEALDAIAARSPAGIVELGAGTGYWARLLADRGVDVVAYDIAPPPGPANDFFAGSQPWVEVLHGDERVVADHPERTLLLVWPNKEAWAADALRAYHHAGGECTVFVGEAPGGRMGDEVMHTLLGLSAGCVACEYAVANAPCVCGVPKQWQLLETVTLPRWGGYEDDLYVFERLSA